jgi:hypothetical protein
MVQLSVAFGARDGTPLPATRVALIPNIHEVRNGAPPLEARRPHSLLFVGGFVHPPNVDAAHYFATEVAA